MATVLFVLAHSDDESMGNGTTIGRHTAAGVEVHLLTATRGSAGWCGLPPGRLPDELVQIRTEEPACAAEVLGLASVELCDYPDGSLEACDQADVTARIEAAISRVRPDLLVGWGPDGGYGHPDHVAIGACTDAAWNRLGAHLPLYHMAVDRIAAAAWRSAALAIRGGDPLPLVTQDSVGVIFDASSDEMKRKARAIRCHASQLTGWWPEVLDRGPVFAPMARECYVKVGGIQAGAVLSTGLFPDLERPQP